jgi:cell division protein FtsL
MIYLLTVILVSSIISWTITHKYQEEIIEKNKEIDEIKKDYEDEIQRLVYEHYEQMETLKQKVKGRRL